MVFSVKQLVVATLGFGLRDLVQIGVDNVADIASVEGLLVLINHLAVKVKHFLSVLGNLVLGVDVAGQVLDLGDVVDRVDLAKQTHSFLDQPVEPLELGILEREPHRHDNVADHVAHRHGQVLAQVGRLVSLVRMGKVAIIDTHADSWR